ncbi:hypothetical protein KKF84_17895, partial [Myxococcota bacterium]|nr:hypothetical protein [Myxococcota bacterium]
DMFPYLGHFHRFYRISFPRMVKGNDIMPSSARKIVLQFAGPLGSARLEWLTNNYIITKDEQ